MLWHRHVNAAVNAYHTPVEQHLRWLVLALREQHKSYWFLKCTSTAQFLQLLFQRFRPYSQTYHLQQQLYTLRMPAGGYFSNSDRFLEIATQQRHMSTDALLNAFLS